jgi:cation diffusion facilitator family transporter
LPVHIKQRALNPRQENLRIQKWVIGIALLLFCIKLVAYILTHSVAILTDALEGTVNVAAGFIGLYSLYVASKPSDENHPYGHGKAEFMSAAIEGTLISVAGIIIIYEAISGLITPRTISRLDYGIVLVAFTALVNYITGRMSIHHGKKNNSLALIASGKHLLTDTYSTVGIIAGLILIYLTGTWWIDNIVAILFSFFIMYTGYKIIRSSIAGIMDEADTELLERMVQVLNANRRDNWIDMHNLRVIKYGGQLHLDCHLTVPWYLNINEAHLEIDELGNLIREKFGSSIEMFVHSDGCLYSQCNICSKEDCPVRQHPLEQRVEWNLQNILSDKKHDLSSTVGK